MAENKSNYFKTPLLGPFPKSETSSESLCRLAMASHFQNGTTLHNQFSSLDARDLWSQQENVEAAASVTVAAVTATVTVAAVTVAAVTVAAITVPAVTAGNHSYRLEIHWHKVLP